jgi:hypothetical protein
MKRTGPSTRRDGQPRAKSAFPPSADLTAHSTRSQQITEGSDPRPPKLLSGRTASSWSLIAAGFGFLVVPLVIPMALAGIFGDPARFILAYGFGAAAAAAAFAASFASLQLMRAQHRESRAGYTTLIRSNDPALWRIDPRTGSALPPSGSPRNDSSR